MRGRRATVRSSFSRRLQREQATERDGARRECGTVYVLVLASAAVATAAGLGGLYIQRTNLRSARAAADIDRARLLATSGLELATAKIAADSNWRVTLGAGNWASSMALGPGTITVAVSDPIDAAINDSALEPIQVVSTGACGSAIQVLSATINMTAEPFSALACGGYGRTGVSFGAVTVNCDDPIASGADMSALLSSVDADVEAVGTIGGLAYDGSRTPGASPRGYPPASIADTWAAMGAIIPYGSIGGRKIEKVLIAPGLTLFGSPANAQGIYVIDCGGDKLDVEDIRVYGTLVVLNCTTCTIGRAVRFDPAAAGYPSLIVEGNIEFKAANATLSESSANVNFNPPGAPWQGATNATKSNTYATGFSGIVLATNDVDITRSITVVGCLLALGDLSFAAGANLTADPQLVATPPPGFFAIRPVLAELEREVN